MIDLHVHTALCGHAEGAPVDYVRAAAERGVRTLAFTDHMPLAPSLSARIPGAEGYAMTAVDLGRYATEVADAASLGAELGVEVLFGIEADLVPDSFDHARAIVGAHPFDIVLGSVHFIDDWAFDDPDRADRYAGWDTRALWERYFSDLAAAARSGVVDVVAHVDLVKKFGHVPDSPVDDLYAECAHVLAETGLAVEVNTAGLRKPCRELYPSMPFLRVLFASGVPVTVGSDAHVPGDVGRDILLALDALRAVGYRSQLVFRGRVPEEVGLDG
jgi:histidinol-phosphatase (PHP family)